MPVGGTGFGGFTAPAKPTFSPFTISPPASQLDINAAAQQNFELNNPGIYNQSSGLSSGSNLSSELSGGATPDYLAGNDFRSLSPGSATPFSDSTSFGPSTSQFSGGTPDPASQGLFTQNPDGSPAGQFLPGEGPGGPSQLLPGEGGPPGGGGGVPDTGGGGGGGVPDTGGGGGGDGGGGGGGGAGGMGGGMGGTPIDIQALGPGTTQPISQWVNQALSTGSGWVTSAEGVATTAINAGKSFGSFLLGGWTSYFIRGFLIVMGILLVIIGLIVLMWDHGGEQVAMKAAKVAVK